MLWAKARVAPGEKCEEVFQAVETGIPERPALSGPFYYASRPRGDECTNVEICGTAATAEQLPAQGPRDQRLDDVCR
jgi:hypothetical protein